MRILFVVLAACNATTQVAPTPRTRTVRSTTVMTDRGAVRGVPEGEVVAWRGIPYAAPPIGDLRFAAPQRGPAWSGVRDAAGWSSPCVEISTSNVLLGGSEDCLYLNVWSPQQARGTLPVLVFVHGGFALNGSSSQVAAGDRMYDGGYVARHGPAIVVTMNYRLGAFGFFAAAGARGNFGLQDQIAALHWVHDNIAAFGGDPAHVLLFGESAGGTSTCALYASPRAAGLFSAAMIESGSCIVPPAGTIAISNALIHTAGCDGATDVLACLRAKPADVIATAAPFDLTREPAKWGFGIDGDIIPVSPLAAIQARTHNHVPLVVGNTTNEFSTLIGHYRSAPLASDAEYRAVVARWFKDHAPTVLDHYPSGEYASPQQAFIALLGDAYMICPARRITRAAAASQPQPVRRFVFAHTYESGPERPFGAGHALDVPFELHNLAFTGYTPTPAEAALSDAMIAYWVRFAATGDPNAANAPAWPRYDAASDRTIVFDDAITSIDGIRTAQCDFWETIAR